jgi:hypothetical protein
MLAIFYTTFWLLPLVRDYWDVSPETKFTIILPVPLTDHRADPEAIRDQAAEFLSSFSDNDGTTLCWALPSLIAIGNAIAIWKVDVEALPFRQGQLLSGVTENARDEAVGRRFLRFRFPLVRFEWQVETPYSALKTNGKEAIQIKLMWKAWTRSYSSSSA